jgi:hypothetical protein
VLVNPDEVDAPVVRYSLGQSQRLFHGDAELVVAPPCCDVFVGTGVDVGVDAQRHAGPLAEAGADAVEVLQLGGRLDVEEQDALPQPRHELLLGLPNTGEDDLLRVEPGPHHPVELPA